MKKNILALALIALLSVRGSAANLSWDPNITAGAALGGPGAWDTTSLQWYNGTDVIWANSSTAVFSGTTAGTVTLAAGQSRTVTGLTFLTNGYTLDGGQVATLGTTAFGAVNAVLSASPTVTGIINTRVTGTGGFTVDGGGTIKFDAWSNVNGQTGPVTIKNGSTLNLAYPGAIGGTGVNSGDITLSGDSRLQTSYDSQNTANNTGGITFLTTNRNIILQDAAGDTLIPPPTATPGLYGGIISGTILRLTGSNNELRISNGANQVNTFQKLVIGDKSGSNLLTASSNCELSIGQGVTLGADANLGAVPSSFMQDNITMDNNAILRFLGGGGQAGDTTTLSANRGFTINSGNAQISASSANAVIPGKITGPGMLTKIGGQILTVKGQNDYSGGTTISAGTLQVSNTSGSGTGSGLVAVNGGTLAGTGTIDPTATVTLAAGARIAPGAGLGNSVLKLPNASFASGTFLDSTLGATGNSDVLRITTADTGLDLSGGTITVSAISNPAGQVYTLIDYPTSAGTGYTGSLGSMIINNLTGYDGTTVSDDHANHRIMVTVGSTVNARTWSHEVNDFPNWSAADGANWSAGSQANGIGSVASFLATNPLDGMPIAPQTVTISDNSKTVGTLILDNPQPANAEGYKIAAAVATNRLITNTYTGNALISVNGFHTITASMTFTAATDVNITAGSQLTVSIATNNGGMNKLGDGTLVVVGGIGGNGAININKGKLLYQSNAAGLSDSAVITIAAGATLDMGGPTGTTGINDTIGDLAGGGNLVNLTGTGTTAPGLSLAGYQSTTFSGVISGSGTGSKLTLSKENGSLNLTNANTYTGGTAVSTGTLFVNNTTGSATGTGTVAVTNGNGGRFTNYPAGVLGGNGSVAGLVTVATGATISPGNGGIGVLTANGGLTLSATGSLLKIDLDTISGVGMSDKIVANGVTTITGGTVNLTNLGSITAGTYTLIDYAGTLGGTFANLVLGTKPAGFTYSLVNNTGATSIDLQVTAAGLAGDYNNDGKVDAADYVVWRKNPSTVGGGDPIGYNTWRANFGTPPGSGSGSLAGGGAVPEPSTLALLILAVSAGFLRKRR